jgi:TonB family protein
MGNQRTIVDRGATPLLLFGALLLLGCARPTASSSALEPTLGRSQPVSSAPARPSSTSTRQAEPTTGDYLPLAAVMARAVDTPDPDPKRLRETEAARAKQAGSSKIGFCVAEDGRTRDIEVLVAYGDPGVDAIFIETIERWRFEPLVVHGQPIVVCTSQVFRVEFEGGDPPDEPVEQPVAPSEPTPTVAPPAPVTELEEQLCRHITALVLAESNSAAELSGDRVDELIASCSLALAQDRRKLGEAEFGRRAGCVRKASSVEGLSRCGASSDQ